MPVIVIPFLIIAILVAWLALVSGLCTWLCPVRYAELCILLFPCGVLGAPVAWGVLRRRRGRAAIHAALERRGYEVIQMEHRLLRHGPFARTTRSQSVWRVRVRKTGGQQRTVWARWGRRWLLQPPDTLELHWEE